MEKNEFEVKTAINGHEAFEIFKDPVLSFDLVILDLNMPISDGYETCQNILRYYQSNNLFKDNKKENHFASPVIVACSSFVNQHILSRTQACGF